MASSAHFRHIVWAGLCSIGITAILGGLLSLPGIPYNVGELLGRHFSLFQLWLLAIAILWMGAGGATVARITGRLQLAILMLPVLTIGAGIVSYVVLNFAVTGESMRDIVGSPVLWREITQAESWGGNVAALTSKFLNRYVVDQLEYCGRFIALTGPVTLTLTALYCGYLHRRTTDSYGFVRMFAYALPWLILCKFIVIEWAGTDNIKELVAEPGSLGIGGIYAVYGALFLICACAINVRTVPGKGISRWLFLVAAIAVCIPLSWLLLKLGLAASLSKNGQTFSGLSFLLGPNRETVLPAAEMFIRWAVLFVGAVLVLAAGLFAVPAPLSNRRIDIAA